MTFYLHFHKKNSKQGIGVIGELVEKFALLERVLKEVLKHQKPFYIIPGLAYILFYHLPYSNC